jgi:hypothetical protein
MTDFRPPLPHGWIHRFRALNKSINLSIKSLSWHTLEGLCQLPASVNILLEIMPHCAVWHHGPESIVSQWHLSWQQRQSWALCSCSKVSYCNMCTGWKSHYVVEVCLDLLLYCDAVRPEIYVWWRKNMRFILENMIPSCTSVLLIIKILCSKF